MIDQTASVFQGDLPIEAKLDRARAELLDLSARNRLLNVPRFSKAAKTIEIVGEVSAEVFRMLVREGKAFTFSPGKEREAAPAGVVGEDDDADALADLPQPEDGEAVDGRGLAARHTDTRLQTRMTSTGLQTRLLDLYNDARTLEEEQGVNILFLALGLLRWTDPANATQIRHAPLILLPVRLERGAAGERFRLRPRPEDWSSNLSLEAYLDRVHSLRMPAFEAGDDFDPAAYLGAVAEAVAAKPDWAVLADDMVLGFFSFAKFLMWRDLDVANWPQQATLSDHPIIRALLSDGFAAAGSSIPEDARIDAYIEPRDMLHIVDCDSSQAVAVHDVRAGRNLVIQGPPGTGKSQTIANVIASAVADGKTVLFVAEKMAALDVVKRRLDQAGVGDACLELHSSKANKRLVLDELKRTWSLGSPRGEFPDSLARRLTDARDTLNAHTDRMHTAHEVAGLTAYQVIGQLARLHLDGRSPSAVRLVAPELWSADDRAVREDTISELARRVDDIGRPDDHPWRGVGLTAVLPPAVDRLIDRIATLAGQVGNWQATQDRLAAALEVTPPQLLSQTPALVALARRVASAPALEAAALASGFWDAGAPRATALLQVCRECQRLLAVLDGHVAPGGMEADVAAILPQLAWLPAAITDEAFAGIRTLSQLMPRLVAEADKLRAELGGASGKETLASAAYLVATGECVAAAPHASPEAFAATVWDHGVEQAGDLADAVATLEATRRSIGDQVTEAAWSTDVAGARQALATHTGMMKRLNADWRRASAVSRSVLHAPDAPLAELLATLDTLMKAQAAAAAVRAGDGFGRQAFGADWRGERSASAPLQALVTWMRTLRGLGAEPRLIASRVPERSAVRDRAASAKRLMDEVRPLLSRLWIGLGAVAVPAFDDASSIEQVDLGVAASRIAAISTADAKARAVVPEAADPQTRLERLREVASYQDTLRRLSIDVEEGTAAFGAAWMGATSDCDALERAAQWIACHGDIRHLAARTADRAGLAALGDVTETGHAAITAGTGDLLASLATDAGQIFGTALPDLHVSTLLHHLALWRATGELLSKWVAYRDRAGRARSLGLGDLVDRLQDARLAPADALPEFEMAYFEALLTDMARTAPDLARFDGVLHGSVAREFATLDLQRIKAASFEVVRAHHRRIPPEGGVGPVGILRAEMVRRRGHMPIRQLMQKASAAVQALKPVLMMSPLSVAQFLPAGLLTFDLLVMDEASQIQPVDALGAIARARQVVVVGDERQLPPTRFFAKMTGAQPEDEEDGAQVSDIESILGLFTARGLPQRMLRWHYRSRHQSLIAVSNSQFYENKLFIVPSPYTQEAGMGLSFRHVPDGVFDAGASGTNAVEARVVAEAVIRHAKMNPAQSLGVATFSAAQRRAVGDELERLRRLNPDTEAFFHAHASEPFFVKNLENVQGDERDVIMISVGYGKNASGTMAMRFGPLAADGGERRLNVLISRAKLRCEVFASFTDEDIDLERVKGRGVFAFKLFLHYARTGRLSMAQATARGHDSPFEEQVARALKARGYQVHPQVGIAGFFIDLAVADPARPGRYILGIECDGASYHSSRSARDRDRLRQAVLEDHGWIIHRVWSTDWFQRPKEQMALIAGAVEAAMAELDARAELGSHAGRAVPVEVVTVEREDTVEIGLAQRGVEAAHSPIYVEAQVTAPTGTDMHDLPTGRMAELVAQVVAVEGPVHLDEVVLRLRTAWGLQRAGGRIQAAVERGANTALQRGHVVRRGQFLSAPTQTVTVRDRSGVTSQTLRRPEMLPPAEVAAAVVQVVRASLGASADEVVQTVARLFGFRAMSSQIRAVVQTEIDALLAQRRLGREGALLVEITGGVEQPGVAAFSPA